MRATHGGVCASERRVYSQAAIHVRALIGRSPIARKCGAFASDARRIVSERATCLHVSSFTFGSLDRAKPDSEEMRSICERRTADCARAGSRAGGAGKRYNSMDEEILILTQEQLGELKKRFLHGSRLQEKSYVRLSDDRMEAWMYLAEPSGEEDGYKIDTLMEMLQNEGVTTGYLMPRLTAMCKKGVYQREILVAKGKPVQEGEDGYYEYFFSPDNIKTGPAIREDGSVDYSSMNMLQSVRAGDVLAEYHPAVAGEDGYTVSGEVLKSRPIKELQPLRGMSVERRENTYYAKSAGKIEMKNGNIDIRMLHEIPGDVDLATNARIEFFGDIEIGGNVSAGVVIRAGRNLMIEGTVESAEIFAGGDIVLKRGVQGNMKGRVRARGNIYANFIEQCNVNAELNIEANYILNANVKAGNRIIVRGKRGSIVGGKVSALGGVEAFNLGNSSEVRTIIHAGYEREIYDRYTKWVEKEKEIKEKLEDILEKMEALIKSRQFQGESAEGSLLMLNSKKDEYFKRLDEIGEEIGHCLKHIEKGRGARINVEGKSFKSVILSIGNYSRQITGEEQYATYRILRGEIVLEPYREMQEEEEAAE